MAKKLLTLTDQVRQAMRDSEFTRYRIAQATGIDQSALGKFFHGERGISSESLDKLGAFLGLRIVVDRKSKKGK